MEEKQNNQLPSAPHVNDTNDLADILSGFIADNSEGTATKDSVQDLMSEDMQSLLTKIFEQTGLPTHTEGSMSAAGGTAKDARQAYFDAMSKFETAKTSHEKEYWANIAAQYQSEFMRDSDRAYNSATSQIERLMAAGMSRQAAMAVVQNSDSQGQAAGVQSQAPTKLEQGIDWAQRAAETCSSMAGMGANLIQIGKLLPHQVRAAESVADREAVITDNLKYEQTGRDAANKFSSAAYEAGNLKALTEGQKFDPTTMTSVAEVKELIKWGYDHGALHCKDYVDNWQSVCEGNLYAQGLVQRGYDGWVSTKDYDPMEDMQPYMKDAIRNDALKKLPQLLNEWETMYETQANVDLLRASTEYTEEKTVTEQLVQKLTEQQTKQSEAQTALIWKTKRGQEILNDWNEAQYDLWSQSFSPAEAARLQCVLGYWTQMAEGITFTDAVGRKVTGNWSAFGAVSEQEALKSVQYLNQERFNYMTNPAKWDKEHKDNPQLMTMVHNYAGTLDAIAKEVGIDLTKAQTSKTKVETAVAPMQAASSMMWSASSSYNNFQSGMNYHIRNGMLMTP